MGGSHPGTSPREVSAPSLRQLQLFLAFAYFCCSYRSALRERFVGLWIGTVSHEWRVSRKWDSGGMMKISSHARREEPRRSTGPEACIHDTPS